MQDQELFQRIIDFNLDNANHQLSFIQRLAKRHAWALDYATQLVQEYRRFMYLVAISDQEISPSKTVDEAWHLHLEDPEDYTRFCDEAIGEYIEHRPASEEGEYERMRAQYARTLELYRNEFEEAPHLYYWGSVKPNKLDTKHYKTGKDLSYLGGLITVGGVLVLGAGSTLAFIVIFTGVAMASSGILVLSLNRPDIQKSGGCAACGGGSGSSEGGGAACGGGGCGGGGCGGG